MARMTKPQPFIQLDEFLVACHTAIAEHGPDALISHWHTRKREPTSGRLQLAPGVSTRALGKDTTHGVLICECGAQEIIDAAKNGLLIHKNARAAPRATST